MQVRAANFILLHYLMSFIQYFAKKSTGLFVEKKLKYSSKCLKKVNYRCGCLHIVNLRRMLKIYCILNCVV